MAGIAPVRQSDRLVEFTAKARATILSADSDDLARVFRFDLAQDSEMISPTVPI
jgi:hypothetical protein